ncbi:MAG: ATP synthase F1 subunit gamma [Bdellovibrionales bacterium RBG_16_40_8]|nr:MAG: ATP synthase F1 subunit gamma [Bdellovibrionales bacterium RBG_16_40_8]
MPSLRDMRARIQSVKNTQQITRAMKMVSAAKLRRAQEQIVSMRPYAQRLLQIISDVALTQRMEHPLFMNNNEAVSKKALFIVMTSDRGLCGGFNSSVCRFTENFINENRSKYEKMDFIFIGKKGADYFRRRKVQAKRVMLNLAREISYVMAEDLAQTCMTEFSTGDYDEVKLIYNEFKSVISQKLTVEKLLPIDLSKGALADAGDVKFPFSKDLIFEPSPREIIDELLVQHFAMQVYRGLSESVAAEHAARMTAMENATKNAKEMISKMTLVYNKVRQASITKELIEICSGAEAVNSV